MSENNLYTVMQFPRQGISLVMVILFMVVASLIGISLSSFLSTEFYSGVRSYNVELSFYATDAGVARGKQILKENPNWLPWRCKNYCDPYCDSCVCPASCTESDCKNDTCKDCYLLETYHIPAAGAKEFYYRVYVQKGGGSIKMKVDGGKVK